VADNDQDIVYKTESQVQMWSQETWKSTHRIKTTILGSKKSIVMLASDILLSFFCTRNECRLLQPTIGSEQNRTSWSITLTYRYIWTMSMKCLLYRDERKKIINKINFTQNRYYSIIHLVGKYSISVTTLFSLWCVYSISVMKPCIGARETVCSTAWAKAGGWWCICIMYTAKNA
jgi:hypothetical protein